MSDLGDQPNRVDPETIVQRVSVIFDAIWLPRRIRRLAEEVLPDLVTWAVYTRDLEQQVSDLKRRAKGS